MSLLEMREIRKEFPGVKALDGVTFDLHAGEFHALVGENGAGKSTLMKVLSGVYPYGTYDGDIVIDGELKQFHNIRQAEDAGIAIIFQELSLVKELTVAENIFLGREPTRFGVINWSEVYSRSAKLLRELNLPLDPRTQVGKLGIGQQQLVEIAKALSHKAKILVLDEPTAALTESEVETLFTILRDLKSRGVGMIYISHKLGEVFVMSDRITVLRDGRTVGTESTVALDKDRVISLMVGRAVGDIFPETTHDLGDTALEVRGLTAYDPDVPDKRLVDDVSFSVRKGEVLGIAGLMGAGRSELLMTIFGAWRGKNAGEFFVEGKKIDIEFPSDAIENGIGFVTEDRKRFGLILDQTIRENSTLAGLKRISGTFVTHRSRETVATRKVMKSLRVKANSPMTITGTLSGGNQQKVVLGKWLLTEPKILFLDEPTRGIDVGAKQEIYAEINKLAASGVAIVMVSSELPEVLGLADRVLVLHEGKLTGEFIRSDATPEKVMVAATGESEYWFKGKTMNEALEEKKGFKIETSALRAYTMLGALVVIWLLFHWQTDGIFLTPRNLSNLMLQTSVTGILAVGMLMVIVSGNIDLSVGSVLGLAGGVAAILLTNWGYGLVPAIAVAIVVGVAIGLFQGFLTAYAGIPAFIVTLGGLLAWRGAIKGISASETVPIADPAFKAIGQSYVSPMIGWVLAAIAILAVLFLTFRSARAQKEYGLGSPDLGKEFLKSIAPIAAIVIFIYVMNSYAGVPIPVLILLAVALIGYFITNNTTFGRYLYAIGGNADAARLSGINNKIEIVKVFAFLGALTGIAALIFTGRVGSAAPDAGVLKELDAIAACVIGGTSLMGGRGTVFGACLGALIMASLDNGMSLLNVRDFMQEIVKGGILVAAVGLDMMGKRS